MIEIKDKKILVADKKLDEFADVQARLWDALFQKNSAKVPLQKIKLDEVDLKPFLPSLGIGDFLFDENGNIFDMEATHMGEKLAKFYGQRKGQRLIGNYSAHSFRTDLPTNYYQFKSLIDALLEKKCPLLMISHYKKDDQNDIIVKGFVIPVTNVEGKIDCVIGCGDIEVIPNE